MTIIQQVIQNGLIKKRNTLKGDNLCPSVEQYRRVKEPTVVVQFDY